MAVITIERTVDGTVMELRHRSKERSRNGMVQSIILIVRQHGRPVHRQFAGDNRVMVVTWIATMTGLGVSEIVHNRCWNHQNDAGFGLWFSSK